jgi:hypothetical protein
MLRNAAKRLEKFKPLTSKQMLDNAEHFEDLAVRVQAAAQEEDSQLAKSSLDCHLHLFNGQRLLDLAVMVSPMRARCRARWDNAM